MSSPKLGRFSCLEESPEKHAPFLKQRMKWCLNQWLKWEMMNYGDKTSQERGLGVEQSHRPLALEVTDSYKSLLGLVMGPTRGGIVQSSPGTASGTGGDVCRLQHWQLMRLVTAHSSAGAGKGFRKKKKKKDPRKGSPSCSLFWGWLVCYNSGGEFNGLKRK